MRRFDRLRKTARALAKNNGHDLGFFERAYYCFPYIHDSPTQTYTGNYIMTDTTCGFGSDDKWFKARCIYCKKECWINERIDLQKMIYVDYYIQQALMLNSRAKENGEKLPMPKKAKGIIFGECLLSKCGQCGV